MSEEIYKQKYLKYKKKYLDLKQYGGSLHAARRNKRSREKRLENERKRQEEQKQKEEKEKAYILACETNKDIWATEIKNLSEKIVNESCETFSKIHINNGGRCENLNNERDIFHNSFVNKVNKCTNDNLNHFNELFILGVKETDYNKQKEINKTIYDMYDNYLNFNDQHRVDARDKTLYLINKLKILDPTVSCDKLKEIKNEYLYELKNKIELNKTVITNGDYENLLKLHKEKMNTQKCTIMSNLPSLPSLPTSLTNLLSSKK